MSRRERSKEELKASITDMLAESPANEKEEVIQAKINNEISVDIAYLLGDLVDAVEGLTKEIYELKLAMFEIERGVCQKT